MAVSLGRGSQFRAKTVKRLNRIHEIIMSQDTPDDNQILPASGEDKQHLGVNILDLRFASCRYVVRYGEDNEAFFCGEAIHRVSYCKTHYSACYIPSTRKE